MRIIDIPLAASQSHSPKVSKMTKPSRRKSIATVSALAALLLALSPVRAMDFSAMVPLLDKGVSAYYVGGEIEGVGEVEFMVDTGSGYVVINQAALDVLVDKDLAHYDRQLKGVLADGSTLQVPVYRIAELTIGDSCRIKDVEAAVFPGRTRFILGLSALKLAAPFAFAMDPPRLALGRCTTQI